MAISLTYTFSAGTRILSSQVNSNFSTLSTRALDKTGDTMTGDLKFTDASYDIGKSGATRPRDIFASRNAVIGGTLGVTGVATFTAAPVFSAGLGTLTGDLLFTDATYDIGKTGATRPRDFFASRNSEIGGTMLLGGALTLTAGQVVFPASQNASAGANTLDDYEEGTWTPADGSGAGLSITNTSQAIYMKIGQLVYVAGHITYPATGSGSTAIISGLPFTSNGNGYGCLAVGENSYTAAIFIQVDNGATTMRFFTTSDSSLTNANLTTKFIKFAGVYRSNG